MKTNNKPAGPDLNSIINGLTGDRKKDSTEDPKPASHPPQSQPQNKMVQMEDKEHEGRLWQEFLEILNDPEEEQEQNRTKKLYSIDDDIVETLHQCDFGGKPNVDVINSILRAFLIDNIERLRQMHRPRSMSLLDKY